MLRATALALVAGLLSAGAFGQATPSGEAPPADYSAEPFVIEEDTTRIDFENDGTSVRNDAFRVRIQSDGGLQRYGLITFSYQASAENVEIDYIRVRKPDGSVVVTPAENVQDMTAAIAREAPSYTDLHEKHISVKGLSVGDTLETHVIWRYTKPLIPGQFWVSFNVSPDFISLARQVRVSCPRDRAVKWSSKGLQPVVADEGSRRIYTWTTSQLTRKPAKGKSGSAAKGSKGENADGTAAEDKSDPASGRPEVQMSSFQSWVAVGDWFRGLIKERMQPSAEVRAKAAELTKGLTNEDQKVQALYNYVSLQIRYIGISFGVGRYQPHAAAEVLANQFGDCKDKHTLLAALLAAIGVRAYPALINSSWKIDEAVPSPGQFDHLITAVPRGSGYLWLDTTPEVAPLGYLIGPLRDKRALVIPGEGPPVLVATEANPPKPSLETYRGIATLRDDGTMEGTLDWSVQGDDSALVLRAAFRKTPMPQWKELVQLLSRRFGFAGEVDDVRVESVSDIEQPLRWTYKYTRKDFPDFANRRIADLMPPMGAALPDEKSTDPIPLGGASELRYSTSIKLPAGSAPQLPPVHDLQEAFADYSAKYTFEDGSLKIERRMIVKKNEVAPEELDAYRRMAKAVAEDNDRFISLDARPRMSMWNYEDAIWDLPYSKNRDAALAYDEARAQFQKHDKAAEIAALEKAVRLDPKFTRARLWLGDVYKSQRKEEAMFAAYKAAIQNDPQEPLSYKVLAYNQLRPGHFDEGIATWKQLIALAPDDPDGYEGLGYSLLSVQREKEAIPAFETATRLDPARTDLFIPLGMAYLNAGQGQKGVEAFRKGAGADADPRTLAAAAGLLTDANLEMPLALEYAERSARENEAASTKTTLANLEMGDLYRTVSLGAAWESMGRIHEKMGHLDRAQRYLEASWSLTQSTVAAEHLAKVYERQHKTDQASRMTRLAGQGERSYDPTGHGKPRPTPKPGDSAAKEELVKLRTVKLEPFSKETGSAEYFILVGQGSKVLDAKFVSGDDALRKATPALKAAKYDAHLPDDSPMHIVRRGVVMCSEVSGCSIVLYTPALVRSLE